MTPAAALKQAQADGLTLSLTPHGTVKIKGPQSALDRWKPALRECKAGLLELLQPEICQWSGDDWRTYFHERAGIAEFDGGLNRQQSERMAYRSCVSEWMRQNFQTSEPGQCAWCGRGDLAGSDVMPYGNAPHGHTWLHGECWPAWYAQRRQAAIAALEIMGVRQ